MNLNLVLYLDYNYHYKDFEEYYHNFVFDKYNLYEIYLNCHLIYYKLDY